MKFLRYDAGTRELWLVYADLWDGQHHRDEFRVVGWHGKPVRNRPDLDGRLVYGSAGESTIKSDAPEGGWIKVFTEEGQKSQTVKTECRRLASPSKRARCKVCDAERKIREGG